MRDVRRGKGRIMADPTLACSLRMMSSSYAAGASRPSLRGFHADYRSGTAGRGADREQRSSGRWPLAAAGLAARAAVA
jgi:hypothetical protein